MPFRKIILFLLFLHVYIFVLGHHLTSQQTLPKSIPCTNLCLNLTPKTKPTECQGRRTAPLDLSLFHRTHPNRTSTTTPAVTQRSRNLLPNQTREMFPQNQRNLKDISTKNQTVTLCIQETLRTMTLEGQGLLKVQVTISTARTINSLW